MTKIFMRFMVPATGVFLLAGAAHRMGKWIHPVAAQEAAPLTYWQELVSRQGSE
jgi:hypothetical protein